VEAGPARIGRLGNRARLVPHRSLRAVRSRCSGPISRGIPDAGHNSRESKEYRGGVGRLGAAHVLRIRYALNARYGGKNLKGWSSTLRLEFRPVLVRPLAKTPRQSGSQEGPVLRRSSVTFRVGQKPMVSGQAGGILLQTRT